MTRLTRWNPARELMNMREWMDQMFGEAFGIPRLVREVGGMAVPPVDLSESEDAVIAKFELPGVKPDQVDIQVHDGTLTVRGSTEAETTREGERYDYYERHHGTFERSLRLPDAVNADKAKAVFENGVLTLTLPKREDVKQKRIEIESKK